MNISKRVHSDESLRRGSGKRILRWPAVALAAAFCFCLLYLLKGSVLRRVAVRQIVELTGARAETSSVHVGLGGSVLIENLLIRPGEEGKPGDVLFEAESLSARFGIGSLLLLRPRLKEITVKDFVLDARCDLDTGRWNLAALKIKLPKGGAGGVPFVNLENGTLKYSEIANGQVKAVAATPLEMRFGPAEKDQDGYVFNIETAEIAAGLGRSNLHGHWRPGNFTVAGGISSADIPELRRVCAINALAAELNYDRTGAYSLKLRIKDLVGERRPGTGDSYPQKLLKKFAVFTALQTFFGRYDPQGRIDIDLDASGSLKQLAESKLRGTIHCKDVSVCDRKFPYPIKHVAGWIDFTEKSAELRDLCGWHGDVKMAFGGSFKYFGQNRHYEIRVTSENMALDKDLYDALNAAQKKFWSDFSPSGRAAIDYRFGRRSPAGKTRALTVELLDVQARYRYFPYPLENLRGWLFFTEENITVSDVISQYNGRKIVIDGKVAAHHGDRPLYDVSVRARNIPLDPTLAACLSDRQRCLYDGLNITGLADAEIQVLTSEDGPAAADVTADITLRKACLKLYDLPMVLSDVSVRTVVRPDLIRIRSLRGNSGDTLVSLTGRIWPGADSKELRYDLVLQGEKAPLNDDLFGLLPASLGTIVHGLRPKGKINYRVDLNKAAGYLRPDYKIAVECLGNSFKFDAIPYPLENLTGSLRITADKMTPQSAATGSNVGKTLETTHVLITGQLTQTNNSFDDGQLDLDLRSIRIFGSPAGERCVDFIGAATFKNCNLDVSTAVTELDAVLQVECLYKIGQGFDSGLAVLRADGLRVEGKSLTELNADLIYDRNQQSWLTRNLVAGFYGGSLTGRFELKQPIARASDYLLQVAFENVDLKEFLRDRVKCIDEPPKADFTIRPGAPETSWNAGDTSGKFSGSLCLAGLIARGSHDDQGLAGRCKLTIWDIQVGRLSPLAKLLYVLKLTEPQAFAFDRMVVDSYIKQGRAFLEHFDLSGDALAFNGSGWMDLESRNVELLLFARGSRLAAAKPSVFQSLTENVGQAFVQIEVSGSYCDPRVTTTALPVIKGTLGILGKKPAGTSPRD
ncbi:MAG: hypothetical protein ACYS76_11325 [Planctomycetota bacterium]|jgi:hypothetical protein